MGADGGDAGQGLSGGAGLADDLDVVLGGEQGGHAAPDDLVIVQKEHPDRVASIDLAAHGAIPSGLGW
ncbi:hypothetical protein GCM10010191_60730 [Actinomadura vinacea]|uniref:Uncharacterized protein n=1 Tax=Actinomadura vinacea TaxID=115336 RepID=A0ABP5WVX4_9ACTN